MTNTQNFDNVEVTHDKLNKKKRCICIESKKIKDKNDENNIEYKLPRFIKLNYVCMAIFAFLTGCDFAVIIPTLWDRLNNDFNANGIFMGFVISSYSLSGVISGIIMGKISDEINRTKIFYLISIIFAIIGQFIYFIGVNKYVVLLSRLICGMALGATSVALAYIARSTDDKLRTSIISLMMASRQIGLLFGPAFNFFLRNLNFVLFDRFICDRKSAPGLFMSILWFVCLFSFFFLHNDRQIIIQNAISKNDKLVDENEIIIINTNKYNNSKFHYLNKKQNQDDTDNNEENEKFIESDNSIQNDDIIKTNNNNNNNSNDMRFKSKFYIYKKEFLRTNIAILLIVTFFTYFNQTSLETIVIPFTQAYLDWSEIQNSLLFCTAGTIIILSYILVRFLSHKYNDRFVLIFGITSILIGLSIGCLMLPFAKPLPKDIRILDNNNNNNNSTILENKLYIDNYERNMKLFPIFIIFVLLDVMGLPAVATSSVSLFTKMVSDNVQGLGQGIQRGVLGVATIVGPLYTGPFVQNPIVLIATTLVLLAIIFIVVLFKYKQLMPIENNKQEIFKNIENE